MANQQVCKVYFAAFLKACILFLMVCVSEVKLACPPGAGEDDSHVIDFEFIPEDQYDRNYSDITEEGKRPLGFMSGILYYFDEAKPNPCIRLKLISNRWIETMAETVPAGTKLCFRDSVGSLEKCELSGTIYACQESRAQNEIYFEFFCDQTCSQSDVNFWYRFTLSEVGVDPELWCMGRDTNEYPSTLLPPFPPSYSPNPVSSTTQDNGSSIINVSMSVLLYAYYRVVGLLLFFDC